MRIQLTRSRLAAPGLALLTLLLAAAPALAESRKEKEAQAEADAAERSKRAQQEKERQAKAPPPAIPGAVSSGEAAPASRNPAEMSPNDALFDAINRGDGPAARDAINRGAQLEAKNVLGQTPLDAAIEANRNDITFLLLSLRGTVAAPRTAGGPARTVKSAPVKLAIAPHKTAARVATADRGSPNPEAGFTGF